MKKKEILVNFYLNLWFSQSVKPQMRFISRDANCDCRSCCRSLSKLVVVVVDIPRFIYSFVQVTFFLKLYFFSFFTQYFYFLFFCFQNFSRNAEIIQIFFYLGLLFQLHSVLAFFNFDPRLIQM